MNAARGLKATLAVARVWGVKRFAGIDAYLDAERDARRDNRGGWRRCDWR